MQLGFDHQIYLKEQSKRILQRVENYQKLYLEFGGKLLWDLHAARVLPGFHPDGKLQVLSNLKEEIEVIICIYAGDIQQEKIRSDFENTYSNEVFKLIKELQDHQLRINSVVITRYQESPNILRFRDQLQKRGIKNHAHYPIKDYPHAIEKIISPDGYGQNTYIQTSKPIILVTGVGAGSGKLTTCLSQLYHDHLHNIQAGYAKFETFPIRDLPVQHPLNIAYEAATLDLNDINMIDPFHLEKYGQIATNYNRDIEAFPLLQKLLTKITTQIPQYASPTDMGVNNVKKGIINENCVKKAAEQEIIRRYFKTSCAYAQSEIKIEALYKARQLLQNLNLTENDRSCVPNARAKLQKLQSHNPKSEFQSVIALDLWNKTIITGKDSSLMDAASAALLNTLKHLMGCDDSLHLLAPEILAPIQALKQEILKERSSQLQCHEALIALSISAAHHPLAQQALNLLPQLRGIQGHSTHILPKHTTQTLRKLWIDITAEPVFLHQEYNQ